MLSEYGEGRGGEYVFLAELRVCHTEHEYALNKHHKRPQAACDSREYYADYARACFAKIKVLHAEAAEKNGQQSCHAAAFAFGAAGVESVVVGV